MYYHPYRYFDCLIDCAVYFSQTYTEKGSGNNAVVTLLLEKSITKLIDVPKHQLSPEQSELAVIVQRAQQNGVDVETVLDFYTQWQSQSGTATA